MSPQFMAWLPVNGGQEVGLGRPWEKPSSPRYVGPAWCVGPGACVCTRVDARLHACAWV